MALHLLYESASGYALFRADALDEIGQGVEQVKSSVADLTRFGKAVQIVSFKPFASAVDALNQINAVSEGIMTDELRDFLKLNLPKGKKKNFSLGVYEPKIGSQISEITGIPCQSNELVHELLRGVRMHFDRFIKGLQSSDLNKAQLALGHSYSRAKVKFNVSKIDNMIIQAIFLIDTLDKDINTFCMRVREWFSWHFPELVKIVNDNYLYIQLVKFVSDKTEFNLENIPALTEILGDEEKAREIVNAANSSMGQEISDVDLLQIRDFSRKLVSLYSYRKNLHEYLITKMGDIAPNLASLIGEIVGARLISHAGSLTNLAKCPSSTLQILGAEKALFRAIKTKGNTPKYGLIFHSSFIGRASSRNKGRMARYLANKCSIATRIDCFSEASTSIFGDKLREQVEERLEFYDKGVAPRKNVDVMKLAIESLAGKDAMGVDAAADAGADAMEVDAVADADKGTEKKKKKKLKNNDEEDPAAELANVDGTATRKKNRKKADELEDEANGKAGKEGKKGQKHAEEANGDAAETAEGKKKKKSWDEAAVDGDDHGRISTEGKKKRKKSKAADE